VQADSREQEYEYFLQNSWRKIASVVFIFNMLKVTAMPGIDHGAARNRKRNERLYTR